MNPVNKAVNAALQINPEDPTLITIRDDYDLGHNGVCPLNLYLAVKYQEMETIIAATDFSKPALNALKYAAALTAELKAQLLLVHVVETPLTTPGIPLSGTDFEEIRSSVLKQMDQLKEKLSFFTNDLITIHTEMKFGHTASVLSDLCGEVAPVALVIGQAESGLFPGRHIWGILRLIQYPVLIVPEMAFFCGMKKVVIASDLRQIRDKSVLVFLKNWLGLFQMSPDILHIRTNSELEEDTIDSNILVANGLEGLNPTFHTVYHKDPEQGIFEFLEKKKSDLLVVVPGKYGFVRDIFHRSHSKKIISHSQLPVLVLPLKRLQGIILSKMSAENHHDRRCNGCDGLGCSKNPEREKQVDESHRSS